MSLMKAQQFSVFTNLIDGNITELDVQKEGNINDG